METPQNRAGREACRANVPECERGSGSALRNLRRKACWVPRAWSTEDDRLRSELAASGMPIGLGAFVERAEDFSSDVALEAAKDLPLGEPFRGDSLDVSLR